MSATEPDTLETDFSWLPTRYLFKELHSQNQFGYTAVLATDTAAHMEVFLEIVPVDHFDSDRLFRLEHYFGNALRLKHESLIAPTDLGFVTDELGQEKVFLARRHVEGTTLEQLLEQSYPREKLPNDLHAQIDWMKNLLLAIEQFHTLGITHQEFRLSQLLVDGSEPKLICPDLRFFSKPEYRDEEWSLAFVKSASPELMGLIEQDVNDRSDIYSVGVIFYCLLNGELPFDGSKMSQILSAHLTKQIDHGETDQPPLMKIVSRMLEKIPHDRYQSVSSILEDLDWLLRNEESGFESFVPGQSDERNIINVPTFVSRDDEQAQIRSVLDEVRSGASCILHVHGESGIGKTRLIQETLRETGELDVQVFQSEAREKAGELAIEPLSRLIQNLTRAELSPSVCQKLEDVQEDVYHFFPEFAKSIGLQKPSNTTSNKLAEHETREKFELNRLSRAICRIVVSLASPHEPVVIWIDDCQWLDSGTKETLRSLARWEAESLLIVLSSRTLNEECEYDFEEFDFDAEIDVKPLEDEAIATLVQSMAVALPDRVVNRIVRLADGNPFMAEALLRQLVEDEAIILKDSQWTVDLDKLDKMQATSDATEALLKRLENFPTEVLEQLSIAALIGRSFHASTIMAVAETSEHQTRTQLSWARRQRLIWTKPDGSQSFVHDSIRRALLEQLPEPERQKLHLRLAEYFEANDGDPIDVAVHFDKAGFPKRALTSAMDAAERALETCSFSTAVQLYRIAWRGTPDDCKKQRSQIAERLGNTLMISGEYEESDLWFQRAASDTESDYYRARILMQRGELAFKGGDKGHAVELLENAMKMLHLSIPKSNVSLYLFLAWELFVQFLHTAFPKLFLHRKKSPSRQDRTKWKIYSRLAHCYWYTRNKMAVLWAHLAGMNRAETGAPTRELGQAWSDHAPVMGLIGWFSRGEKYATRSLEVRQSLNDFWGEGQSRNYFSILLYCSAQYEKCIVEAEKAEEILQQTGDFWELNIVRFQRAASLYRLGRLKEAYELSLLIRRDAIKIGDRQSSGNILDILSRSSLGKIPHEFIESEKDRELEDLQLQPQLLLAEGVNYLDTEGDPAIAVDCFERAMEIVRSHVCNSYTVPNAAWLATALRQKITWERKAGTVSSGSFERHFNAAQEAVQLAKKFQTDKPHALREMGYAWADKGNQEKAREYLLQSLKLAQSQEAKYEAALTQQAFERMDVRFGWREVSEENQTGNHEVREIEATVRLNGPRETVSIVNRFDSLLDAGRKISSSLGKRDILKHTVESAVELLRGQTTIVVLPDENNPDQWKAWQSVEAFDHQIVLDSIEEREPIVRDREVIDRKRKPEGRMASVLCCPVVAGRDVVACIYISNRLIESMYGTNEIRIAEFIGNAAGSSLEKETSFRELDDLNASLEQNVAQRTRSLQSRTRELESTAQQLRATQHRLEQAAEAAEAANQIKSDFLAKMSHEIRTPITAVLGFTQLILRGVVSDPEEQRKKIKAIESSGQHLLQLVNDLLDISKIEAEKVEIECIECRPLQLLSEIVESLRPKATENNNDLKLELVAPLPASIQSDPKRMRQVVTNILGNAIKFTSKGTITVKASFAETEGRGALTFDVIDTGIGMTPDQLENVFDPFAQADSSITRRFGGTGLGLSISQKLTRALGGDLEVESELGKGSTFSISIDAGDAAQLEMLNDDDFEAFFESHVVSDWCTADLSNFRVLLADDAQTNRDLISLVLGDCGAKITLAENGQEAVDHALSDKQFDIVLMDMQMPILDGYSATRKLRSEGYDGLIYALTANSMKGDREKCLDAGCSEFLTKPIDLNALVKAMAKVAGSDISMVSEDEADSKPVSKPDSNEKKPIDGDALSFSESDLPQNEKIRKFTFNFFDTLDRRRTEFETCLANRDKEELGKLAHWLKGTSGTVMLSQLSASAKEMEHAIHADDWEAVEAIYGLVEVYADKAVAFKQQVAAP